MSDLATPGTRFLRQAVASAGVPSLLDRLGVELPVLQAGMGGGIADHRLAAAVSEAGGLGTIGMLDPARLRNELRLTRELTQKPVALNVLLPFARSEHWQAATEADALITFWGDPVRRTAGVWIHQCGSVDEARAARAAGADAVIAQGIEGGGHVRGNQRGLELLQQIRSSLPECPVILAGGIAAPADVREALDAGAAAVVAGTRFLLSEESAAHPEYKRRVLNADRTLLTDLFGLGWPSRHRVVPNAATDRWLGSDDRAPGLVRAAHRLTAPAARRLPLAAAARLAANQTMRLPLFGPSAPLASSRTEMVDLAPLYAGETATRISDIRPAGELVRALVA